MSFRSDMDMDPAILAAARAQQMTIMVTKERASEFGMTLHEVLGLEDVLISEVAFTYVPKGPLVELGQERSLPTHMRNLLLWYQNDFIKNKADKEYIYAEVQEEHHFKHYTIAVPMSELFQLFNLRALNKSLLGCYIL
jgi:hypothetical protein